MNAFLHYDLQCQVMGTPPSFRPRKTTKLTWKFSEQKATGFYPVRQGHWYSYNMERKDVLDCPPLTIGVHQWKLFIAKSKVPSSLGLGVQLETHSGVPENAWYWYGDGKLKRYGYFRIEQSEQDNPKADLEFQQGSNVTLQLDIKANRTFLLWGSVDDGPLSMLVHSMPWDFGFLGFLPVVRHGFDDSVEFLELKHLK